MGWIILLSLFRFIMSEKDILFAKSNFKNKVVESSNERVIYTCVFCVSYDSP